MKPRVALFARPEMRKPIADLVRAVGADPIVLPCPRDGRELRYFAHQKQPDAVIIDADFADWDPIQAIPRLGLVKSRPEVIAMFTRLSQREKRRALFAGASAVIDGDAWPVSLAVLIASVKARPRLVQDETPMSPEPLARPVLCLVR